MCKFCETHTRQLYQHTVYMDMYISNFGRNKVLILKPHGCPPFADCCAKNEIPASSFIINYCPECGRKLTEGETT